MRFFFAVESAFGPMTLRGAFDIDKRILLYLVLSRTKAQASIPHGHPVATHLFSNCLVALALVAQQKHLGAVTLALAVSVIAGYADQLLSFHLA